MRLLSLFLHLQSPEHTKQHTWYSIRRCTEAYDTPQMYEQWQAHQPRFHEQITLTLIVIQEHIFWTNLAAYWTFWLLSLFSSALDLLLQSEILPALLKWWKRLNAERNVFYIPVLYSRSVFRYADRHLKIHYLLPQSKESCVFPGWNFGTFSAYLHATSWLSSPYCIKSGQSWASQALEAVSSSNKVSHLWHNKCVLNNYFKTKI